jgi:hypothetical protein
VVMELWWRFRSELKGWSVPQSPPLFQPTLGQLPAGGIEGGYKARWQVYLEAALRLQVTRKLPALAGQVSCCLPLAVAVSD